MVFIGNELVQHDASHDLVLMIVETKTDVKRCGAGFRTGHPVLLIFSVRNLAALHRLVGLDLEEGSADGGADEVALELADLVRDLVNPLAPFHPLLLVALAHCLSLLFRHVLLDFGGLGHVGRGDAERDIPAWQPLFPRQAVLAVLLLKHLGATILEDDVSIVAPEGVEDALVFGLALHLVDNVIEVVRSLAVLQLLLKELAQRLLYDWVDRVHVHIDSDLSF